MRDYLVPLVVLVVGLLLLWSVVRAAARLVKFVIAKVSAIARSKEGGKLAEKRSVGAKVRIGDAIMVAIVLSPIAIFGSEGWSITALLAVVTLLTLAIILMLANLGAYFMKISQGSTAFIDAGDSLKEILPNIGGYGISQDNDPNGRKWLIPEKYISEKDRSEEKGGIFHDSIYGTVWFQKWLWERFGVKFISVFWPHIHVHKFDLREGGRRRLRPQGKVDVGAPLRSRVMDSEGDTHVSSLLFLTPRPVFVEGVELGGDNSKVNLLLLPVFQQVIPSLPVYYLRGDFYTLLDAAIEAAVVDFFANHQVEIPPSELKSKTKEGDSPVTNREKRHITYADWVRLSKAGETSPLEQAILRLNVSSQYLQKLEEMRDKEQLVRFIKDELFQNPGTSETATAASGGIKGKAPDGIIPAYGFAVVKFQLVGWEPHSGDTAKLAAALLEKGTQFHMAEGVREAAWGGRDAKIALANGDAELVRVLAKDLGVTPDVAASVLQAQIRTGNIGGKDSKVTTYVEGGARKPSVLVGATGPSVPKKKEG